MLHPHGPPGCQGALNGLSIAAVDSGAAGEVPNFRHKRLKAAGIFRKPAPPEEGSPLNGWPDQNRTL